jgi:uncharacterized protein (TIGR02001 family)
MRNTVRMSGAFALMMIASGPLLAQQAAPDAATAAADPPFSLELTLAGVSDYRFRGVSLSSFTPAFEPQIALTHQSGLYGRLWGSNIAGNGGAGIEIDLVAGIARDIGNFSVDVGATYYVYPGARQNEYVEFIGVVHHPVGPADVAVTFAYTPQQGIGAPGRGLYGAINGSLPIKNTPFSLIGSFGIEDNGFYQTKKDWSAGVAAELLGFSMSLSYVDTGHTGGDRLGRPTALFSISRVFGTKF